MQGRLIDADALRFEIINKPSEFKATEATIDFLTGLSKRTHEVLDILDEAPTVDAVPVVRCKDCVWWDKGDCYRIELTRPDDFCSRGERQNRDAL